MPFLDSGERALPLVSSRRKSAASNLFYWPIYFCLFATILPSQFSNSTSRANRFGADLCPLYNNWKHKVRSTQYIMYGAAASSSRSFMTLVAHGSIVLVMEHHIYYYRADTQFCFRDIGSLRSQKNLKEIFVFQGVKARGKLDNTSIQRTVQTGQSPIQTEEDLMILAAYSASIKQAY